MTIEKLQRLELIQIRVENYLKEHPGDPHGRVLEDMLWLAAELRLAWLDLEKAYTKLEEAQDFLQLCRYTWMDNIREALGDLLYGAASYLCRLTHGRPVIGLVDRTVVDWLLFLSLEVYPE